MAEDNFSAEQAADFAALQAAASEGEGAAAAQDAAASVPAVVGLSDEIAGLIGAFVTIAAPMYPCLNEIYTPENISQVGEVLGALCTKHGWLSGGLMGDYAEEITAAIVVLPLGFATYKGVKGDIERAQAGRKKRQADLDAHFTITRGTDGQTVAGSKEVIVGQPKPEGGANANQ